MSAAISDIAGAVRRPLRESGCQTGAVNEQARRGRPGHDRDQVLRSAVTLFNEQGYDATSVSQLARRLGVTKSALYHHFSSKEELLAVATGRALDGLEGALHAAETADSASDRLAAVLAGAVGVLVEQLPNVTLLLRVRGNSDVERAALARRRTFDQNVATLVRDAQAEGSVRTDIDPIVATRLVFGMVNSLVDWYRADGQVDAARLADEVLAVALDGLRTR